MREDPVIIAQEARVINSTKLNRWQNMLYDTKTFIRGNIAKPLLPLAMIGVIGTGPVLSRMIDADNYLTESSTNIIVVTPDIWDTTPESKEFLEMIRLFAKSNLIVAELAGIGYSIYGISSNIGGKRPKSYYTDFSSQLALPSGKNHA